MSQYIPEYLRLLVAERARHRCEYCQMPAFLAFTKFHIDHVISIKHRGKTLLTNLAYACPICNGHKGSDVGTVWGENHDVFMPLFNPRKHLWADHFEVENGTIQPKTAIADGTIKLLKFNDLNRVLERQAMQTIGIYP